MFVILTDFMFQNISIIAAHVVINCITGYLDQRKCHNVVINCITWYLDTKKMKTELWSGV